MELIPRKTAAPSPHRQTAAVVFKIRQYDTGAHKTWLFTNIDHVAIVQGRVQLRRDDYGLIFDVPAEEVEQVYTIGEGTVLHVAQGDGLLFHPLPGPQLNEVAGFGIVDGRFASEQFHGL